MSTKVKVIIGAIIVTIFLAVVGAVGQIKQPVTIFPEEKVAQKQEVTKSKNIEVTSPKPNAKVGKSFIVTGQARVFENVVSLRITNIKNNKIYILAVTDAKSPDVGQFGPFSYTINLSQTSLADVKSGDKLLLEVFQQSAKDGSEIDKVQIPLMFFL